MKDHCQKLNEIKKSNNAVFEGIFGFGNNKQPQQPQSTGYVEKVAEGKYRMGKSIITGLVNSTENQILNYRWEDSKLRWLLNSEFEGILDLDLRKGILNAFIGVWKSGVFKGDVFSEGSIFEGGEFGVAGNVIPAFIPDYDKWKTSPINFVDGTIDEETGGILGIENSPNGPINGNINLISIPPKRSIELRLRSNVVHRINFIKRIDDVNSNFIVEFENGETGQSEKKTIGWDFFRMNGGTGMIFNPNKSVSILGFKLNDRIVSAKLINTGSASLKTFTPKQVPEKTEEELAATQQTYDLINAPFIGIKSLPSGYWDNGVLVKNNIGRIYLNASTPAILSRFENVVNNLNNKVLASDFTQLRSYLKNKIITGAPDGYGWLANLIGKDTVGAKIEDTNFIGSLKRIEEFLRDFVGIIVKYAGNDAKKSGKTSIPDEATQELIKTNLKNFLGIKIEAPTTKTPQTTSTATSKLKKVNLPEGLVKIIRDIISEI